jgi:ribA/ribD-fused uncharacterized protein
MGLGGRVMIDSFSGEYRFLSNFAIQEGKVYIPYGKGKLSFNHVEGAYQAMKCKNKEDMKRFVGLNPSEAKKLGREVELRKDWDSIKNGVMKDLVEQKFSNNPDLAEQLLATGNEELIEGNWWNDTWWGVCNGKGRNELGKILMQIRKKLNETNN